VGCDDAIGMYINYSIHLQRLNLQRKYMVVKKIMPCENFQLYQFILIELYSHLISNNSFSGSGEQLFSQKFLFIKRIIKIKHLFIYN